MIDHIGGRTVDDAKKMFAGFVDLVCSEGYQRIGDDDILNGRSGFLLAALQIKSANEDGRI